MRSNAFFDLVHPDDRDRVRTMFEKRVQGENVPSSYEFRLEEKDGNVRWVEVHAVIIDWEGKPAALALLTDFTDRKKAEEDLTIAKTKLEKANEQLKAYGHKITQVQE
jgi:PAS domain S-box-containing protein